MGVLNLTFKSGNPEDCKLLLTAVIQAHQAELYSIYDQASQEKITSLDRLIKALKDQRKKSGEDRIDLLQELRGITTEEVASIRSRVSTLREHLHSLKIEMVDLNDQLDLISKAGNDPSDRQITLAQLTAQLRPTVGGTAGTSAGSTYSILRTLELQRRELDQTVGLGRDHPRILAIESQISAIKSDVGQPTADGSVTLDELGAYAKWAEQKKRTTTRQLEQTQSQLIEDETTLKTAGGLQDQIDALTAQIEQADAEIQKLESEQLTTRATQGAGGYTAEQITPPATGMKIAPVLTKSLMTGFALGGLLGGLMMMFAEYRDKSFRSAAEIRQRLGLPVIGHIPHINTALSAESTSTSELDPSLVVAHRPKSSEAEAYRGLRTQLFFSTQGIEHQAIQVTSPTPGDGKSTLAANLAISIAQAGKRTVLIDCDFRKPRVHKLFGLATADIGFTGIIAGTASLSEGIVPNVFPNLDLLLCGPRPTNPAELLSSPQFQDALSQLKNMYEFVIVDTPPLLAVSDPAIVAPQTNGVLLVFRMTKKVRPLAERAREVLASVGAKTLGVIVNATDARGGGYGYKYGYAYKYGYGYKYSDYEYADNYHDDHTEQ